MLPMGLSKRKAKSLLETIKAIKIELSGRPDVKVGSACLAV